MDTIKGKKKPVKPHWYLMTYGECPVCGRSNKSKERRYTKKPKSIRERYCYDSSYCGCQP